MDVDDVDWGPNTALSDSKILIMCNFRVRRRHSC